MPAVTAPVLASVGRFLVLVLLTGWLVVLPSAPAQAAECSPNPIVCENKKAGTPEEEWQTDGVGDPGVQGFATQMSVNLGERVDFKIDSTVGTYGVKIFRLGWYGGLGARQLADLGQKTPPGRGQPACASDPATEIYDCGTWAVSASWTVPKDAVSGIYLAVLTRTGGDDHSQIPFVVRDDASDSHAVFQTSDSTWQAYNSYGGSNFYTGKAHGRAYKISYNRPFLNRGADSGRDYLFSNEYPMLRFLERNGYDLSYISSLDTDIRGANLKKHKTFISTGHDEYWSQGQRDQVQAARDAGVNLAFFSGNEIYWRTRWEPSQDGSNTANRTLVCYKDTWSETPLDPVSPTSTWRDARGANAPENSLTGTIYRANDTDLPITVNGVEGRLRLWRNTELASQSVNSSTALAPHTVGYESDEDLDNGSRPAGLIRLSTTVGLAPAYLTDYGTTVTSRDTTHHLTLYRASSGALVFSAGTIQWAWGLDTHHDGTRAPVDPRMQQAMINLLADMSTPAESLATEKLVPASASTDKTAPTAVITSPTSVSTLRQDADITVTGTASDAGGRVAAVEVSLDGGSSWHPATGRESWSYRGVVAAGVPDAVQARAVDGSANLQTRPTLVSGTASCPCTLFGSRVPETASVDDASPLTLGIRFQSTTDGFVTGIRFYKGTANTGTHTGALYSADGTRLAGVTFTGESASGWQTATISPGVRVAAGQTYVAAYTAPNGRYAADSWAFGYGGLSAGPLRAAGGRSSDKSKIDFVPNGVFGTGTGMPNTTYKQTNYFVDVVFSTSDTSPLTATALRPAAGATSVPTTTSISARFTREPKAGSPTITVRASGGSSVSGAMGYDAGTRTVTFTPSAALAAGVAYAVTVSAAPAEAGVSAQETTWSFTTARAAQPPGVCPCGLYDDSDQPAVITSPDTGAVEVGTAFSTDRTGQIIGVEFYRGEGNAGPHPVSIWSEDGTRLATASATGESASGWQQVKFDSPVQVAPGPTYVVSYRAPSGGYSYTAAALAEPRVRSPLSTPPSAGRFSYDGGPPRQTSTASYFVDPVFVPGAPTAPKLTRLEPADQATSVRVSTAITATFDTAIKPGSTSIVLSTADRPDLPVAGELAQTSATTVVFTPKAALAESTGYRVVVSGATSTANLPMERSLTSTFTTAGPASCPCSLVSTDPKQSDFGDLTPVVVGTEFSVSTAGYVNAIRYWRDAANGGSHVGTLYDVKDPGGTTSTVTFTDGAPGWQTAQVTPAFAVKPGTTYVAAVSMPQGHYAATLGFFSNPYVNEPLTGVRGVYTTDLSARPTVASTAFYYVDVLFDRRPSTSPPVISKLRAVGVGTSATVSWTTDQQTTGRVSYGTDPDRLDQTMDDVGSSTDHSVELTSLAPGTTYYFRVRATDAQGQYVVAPSVDRDPGSWRQPVAATNLAMSGTATQSSTSTVYPYEAIRAIDGRTDGNMARGSVTQTKADKYSWWQVDLKASYRLDEVTVWNRTDCCRDLLSDWWVLVSDQPLPDKVAPSELAQQPGVWASHQKQGNGRPWVPDPSLSIDLPEGLTGQYVRIQQASQYRYLSLAEVQVDGLPTGVLRSAPAAVDFGSVPARGSRSIPFTLSNAGTEPLTISDWKAPGAPFTVTPSPVGTTLGARETLKLTAAYTPTRTSGADADKVVLATKEGQQLEVALSGSVGAAANLALKKPATQSSTLLWHHASEAVDGVTTGTWLDDSSAVTTLDKRPWWQVDLGAVSPVDRVVVWNSVIDYGDDDEAFWVFVSDTPLKPDTAPATLAATPGVWSVQRNGRPTDSTSIGLPSGAHGRYVLIVKDRNYSLLSLAEVQVYDS